MRLLLPKGSIPRPWTALYCVRFETSSQQLFAPLKKSAR